MAESSEKPMSYDQSKKVKRLYQKLERIRDVDRFTRQTGAIATLFKQIGKEFVRISTTLPAENGSRAIWTRLSHTNPAYSVLLAGKIFIGPVTLFGRKYFAKYAPYWTELQGKKVLLALFAGIPQVGLYKNDRKASYVRKRK